jgi:hypothetical protein
MAQVELTYSALAYNGAPAHNVDLIVTYDPASLNANGFYTATAATGTYTVLNGNGSVDHVDSITGLAPPGTVGGADNLFRIGAQPYVDPAGINYSISNSADTFAVNRGVVNFYSNSFTPTQNPQYAEDQYPANGYIQNVTQRAYVPPGNNAPCYCTGTRILTDHGEVAVEVLAIGDIVITASGARRPIRWIGTRSYTGRFANTNPAVLPVCVRAGALADGIPARDLWVSPDHALYLDDVLIPAEQLVNGATILKAERVESVTYWHVELDSHDVLVAEGAAAESFVDDGGRAIFHNAASFRALYPREAAWSPAAVYCAPRVTDGYVLEAVRRRLVLHAGLPVAPARVFGALRGHLDRCDGARITGWAQDLAHPDGPVCLDVVVDDAVVALACAELYRADLQAAGIGDGRHAFDLTLPQPLDSGTAHRVEVRRSADGALVGAAQIGPGIAIAA